MKEPIISSPLLGYPSLVGVERNEISEYGLVFAWPICLKHFCRKGLSIRVMGYKMRTDILVVGAAFAGSVVAD